MEDESKKSEEPQILARMYCIYIQIFEATFTIHTSFYYFAASLFGSCRLTITLMCFIGSFNALFLTINLGMVIVCMNSGKNNTTDLSSSGTNCTTNMEFGTQCVSEDNAVEVRIVSNEKCQFKITLIHFPSAGKRCVMGQKFPRSAVECYLLRSGFNAAAGRLVV